MQLETTSAADLTPRQFRSRLEQHEDVGRLVGLLCPVVRHATHPHRELRRLTRAVFDACWGAFNFNDMDWNDEYRRRDKAFRQECPRLIKQLEQARRTFSSFSMPTEELLMDVERLMRDQYDPWFRFPVPSDDYLDHLFAALVAALEKPLREEAISDEYRAVRRQHGCLDYGRNVEGGKVRSPRAMLAFNLVFLFRSVSVGREEIAGSMPEGGKPHFKLVTKLVRATMGEDADQPITEEWVRDAERGILTDNRQVTLVAWPTGVHRAGN